MPLPRHCVLRLILVRSSSSYLIDPQWARRFTIAWTSVVAASVAVSLPYLYRSIKKGRAFTGTFGVIESWKSKQYVPVEERQPQKDGTLRGLRINLRRARAVFAWTLPGFDVSVGQSERDFSLHLAPLPWFFVVVLIAGYFATLVSCIVLKSQLTINANRAGEKIQPHAPNNLSHVIVGFMSVAQLPVIFLFAAKNSIMSFLCPGHGYEKLNFIHRWAGRGLFLSAVTHGSLWITQHRKFNVPIIGEQKETSGIAAFGVLCIIVLTSILPVRRWFYQGFFVVQ